MEEFSGAGLVYSPAPGRLCQVARSKFPIDYSVIIALPDRRCSWVPADDPLLLEYHDREWGVPVHSERKHFEVLVLSGAQAGLNWSLVLAKREGYRQAFEDFDPKKVACFSEPQIRRLLADPGIIRNRMKIEGAVRNARAFLKIQDQFGKFDSYCWQFVGGRPRTNRWKTARQVPATSPESEALSKELKRRGFSFVGPTVAYAYMQAVGIVNDHLIDCFRYREILRAYGPRRAPRTAG